MSKDINYSLLLDFYGSFLTERQYDVMRLYYDADLSLAEISEDIGVTRQGVLDIIKRASKKLDGLEETLRVHERYAVTQSVIEELEGEGSPATKNCADRLRLVWEDKNGI